MVLQTINFTGYRLIRRTVQCTKYILIFPSLEFLFPSHTVTTCLEKHYAKDGKSKGILKVHDKSTINFSTT